ncbi:MAG: hypothetical protein ACXU9L_13820 [Thermodesulfobacteriota bacterium]
MNRKEPNIQETPAIIKVAGAPMAPAPMRPERKGTPLRRAFFHDGG